MKEEMIIINIIILFISAASLFSLIMLAFSGNPLPYYAIGAIVIILYSSFNIVGLTEDN